MKATRRYKLGGGTVIPPQPSTGTKVITLTVTLDNSASGVSSTIPEFKYNKSKGWFMFEFDDGSVSAKHTLAKMKTTTYTDGCGNEIPYTAGLALNARFGYDNAEIGLETTEARGSINYTDQKNFIGEGWDLMNHSYYHEINSSQTGSPVWGYGNDPQRNINELDALILNKHDYKMNAMVVPSDYSGFMTAAKNIGYLGGTSTGTFDNIPIIDQYRWPQRISQLTNNDYYAIKREFAITGWGSNTTEPWQRVNDMVNSSDKGIIDIGTHTMSTSEETNFRNWLQSIKDRLGDTILFTSLREFLEYQHLRFNAVKTETRSGNTLTIKIDYTDLPNEYISWHDLSLVLNTGNIISVTSDNDNYNLDYNPVTRLINIKYRKTDWSVVENEESYVTPERKLTLDMQRMFVLDANEFKVDTMFDGSTADTVSNSLGYSLMTNPVQVWYDFGKTTPMVLTKIRIYDGAGSWNLKIYGVKQDYTRVLLVNTDNTDYLAWTEFPITDTSPLRYFILESNGRIAPEIEFYGVRNSAPALPKAAINATNLRAKTGTNGFPFTFYNNVGSNIITQAVDQMKWMGNFRDYTDWHYTEWADKKYTFTQTHNGGWDLDAVRQVGKDNNMLYLTTIQLIPEWMQETYPADQRDGNNVFVKYGQPFDQPSSYIDIAKLGFQHALRYGTNPFNLPASMALIDTVKYQPWHRDNLPLVGMNLTKYIEFGNESDKNWKGRKGYQSGREHAAMLSACYDGHKGTMGNNVGVKTADPGIKVAMNGIATARKDYLLGMMSWFEEFRGYNPDGTINAAFDVLNIHYYSSDSIFGQGGGTQGLPPELGAYPEIAEWIREIRAMKPSLEVWVTELGYDDYVRPDGSHSPLCALPIQGKTSRQVVADWCLRTGLMAGRWGLDRLFYFQGFDETDPGSWGGIFANSGHFLKDSNDIVSKKEAANFQYQLVRYFGNYIFDGIINTNPNVDRYKFGNNTMYALWIPDMINRKQNYTLTLPSGTTSVQRYDFNYNSESATITTIPVTNNQITLEVTETPIFITL